jgi:hypothetical protein
MGWFSKKPKEPERSASSDRYAGKPLLILLENYVLDCIGELPAAKASGMVTVVQRVYGGGEDWKATLRSVLHLGDGIDDGVRRMWKRNKEIAVQNKVTLAPEEFARMVVETNFAPLLNEKL